MSDCDAEWRWRRQRGCLFSVRVGLGDRSCFFKALLLCLQFLFLHSSMIVNLLIFNWPSCGVLTPVHRTIKCFRERIFVCNFLICIFMLTSSIKYNILGYFSSINSALIKVQFEFKGIVHSLLNFYTCASKAFFCCTQKNILKRAEPVTINFHSICL